LNPESIERGRRLATGGDPGARIPACVACHNNSSLESYPRLSGQQSAYMTNRLRLWKGGLSSNSSTDAIMMPIARSLSEQQIEDVSAYFSSLGAAGKPIR
jgi:cytochrome c553